MKPLRRSKFRRYIISLSIKLYTYSHNLISFFSTTNDVHPKHMLMKYHDFFVDNVNESDRVLDIGCSIGILTYDIAEKAKYVVGIDRNAGYLKIAKKRFLRKNIKYVHGDATKYNFDEKYDVITLSAVLEHIKYRIEFLNKIKQLSDKFIIRVPMINSDWVKLYKKKMGYPYLDEDHYIEYTLESFIDELEQVGLKIKKHEIKFGEIWAVVST